MALGAGCSLALGATLELGRPRRDFRLGMMSAGRAWLHLVLKSSICAPDLGDRFSVI